MKMSERHSNVQLYKTPPLTINQQNDEHIILIQHFLPIQFL
jgi:hypothetical protein